MPDWHWSHFQDDNLIGPESANDSLRYLTALYRSSTNLLMPEFVKGQIR